jgi:hypothetical protein
MLARSTGPIPQPKGTARQTSPAAAIEVRVSFAALRPEIHHREPWDRAGEILSHKREERK